MSWEYAALFDAEIRPEADDLMSEMRKNDTRIRVGRMGYRTRTTVAGPRLEAEVFPAYGRTQAADARKAKSKITPEAQARANHARSIRNMILLAETNFTAKDIAMTLTYEGPEPDYVRCQKDIRNFLQRIRRAREKKHLPELRYIYVIEGGDGKARIHSHILMSGGIDRDEIERIWRKSASGQGYANADRLQPDSENGLEAIVIYYAKQLWARGYKPKSSQEDEVDGIARYMARRPGIRRKWCRSHNLKQPKVRTSDSKCSNARVNRIAYDFRYSAKGIMEKLYPGYKFVKCSVYHSDVVDGVYIRCVMRKWVDAV